MKKKVVAPCEAAPHSVRGLVLRYYDVLGPNETGAARVVGGGGGGVGGATSALTAIPVTTIPQVPSAFYPCPTSPPPPCTLPGPPPFFTTLSACDVINIATQCYYSMYTSLA